MFAFSQSELVCVPNDSHILSSLDVFTQDFSPQASLSRRYNVSVFTYSPVITIYINNTIDI